MPAILNEKLGQIIEIHPAPLKMLRKILKCSVICCLHSDKCYFHVACLVLLSLPVRDEDTCPVLDLESLSTVSWQANSSSYLYWEKI